MIDTIVDLNHNDNVTSWDATVKGGVVAVIHKASQGLHFTDPMYPLRRLPATSRGLLWGAYHFATGADGVQQADHFLQAAHPDKDTFIALDLERNPDGPTVTLQQARAFVMQIQRVTGRLPYIYGSDLVSDFAGTHGDALLCQCPLWIARYSAHAPVVPPSWKNWTLWQYVAGETAHDVDALPGLGKVDRSRFAGDLAGLKKVWAT